MGSLTPYSEMQRRYYDGEANNNHAVWMAGFAALDAWQDWEWLMQHYDQEKVVLDFGCGLGRHIFKYSPHFKRVDGVDISPAAIERLTGLLEQQGIESNLYVSDGTDITSVPSDTYDIVCSMTVMQHICVHEIRQSLFREFFRVLKPGGHIAIQMGFGPNSPHTVDYYADNWGAQVTNRGCDTDVTHPKQLKDDLQDLGFRQFRYTIGPVGPGDYHPNWIYFAATKPLRAGRLTQAELTRLMLEHEPSASSSPPSFRKAICIRCSEPVTEMWHLWHKDGGYFKEQHMCSDCGDFYGLEEGVPIG